MADRTAIEWSDATWNPIRGTGANRWMCQRITPGCDHCYAERLNLRFGGQRYADVPSLMAAEGTAPDDGHYMRFVRLDEKALTQPLRWRRGRRIFVCSQTDLFGEWVPDEWLDLVFAVMALAPQHTFQVLTKRAKRMRDYVASRSHQQVILAACNDPLFSVVTYQQQVDAMFAQLGQSRPWPLPNVWLGVSVESQAFVWRLNYLTQTPAAVRFVSAEPLLGPLDIRRWLEPLSWVITGGESGPNHRPMDPAWVRAIHEQCAAAGVAHLHKQNGGRTPKAGGRLVDGQLWDAYPEVAA